MCFLDNSQCYPVRKKVQRLKREFMKSRDRFRKKTLNSKIKVLLYNVNPIKQRDLPAESETAVVASAMKSPIKQSPEMSFKHNTSPPEVCTCYSLKVTILI